jgi:beta-glucosidase
MRKFILILLISFLMFGCHHKQKQSLTKSEEIEKKVDSVLALMTLEEKIGQMSQIRHFDTNADSAVVHKFIGSIIHTDGPTPGMDAAAWQARFIVLQKEALSTRLGIPLLFGVDAVHGQNTYNGATIFPHNIGLGATQNAELVQKIGTITAEEMQATGFNWAFAPCVAIPYNEKWGRVYEAFSESTELTSKLGVATIKGLQGDLQKRNTVLATAKHFIGDGATDFGKEGGETSISNSELSQRLLPPYREAVKAGVGSIMVSFNTLHGIPMHANKALITDTLKIKMKFKGMVVSDWKGYSRFGRNDIINAGVDMVMAVDGDLDDFQQGLKKGIESAYVSQERIDDAVRRILRQKFRLGLFKHPFPDASLIAKIGDSAHRNIARQAVRESLVLLKNDNQALPINKSTKKIVVVGEHANNAGLQSGGWTIAWQGVSKNYKGATTILDGIKKMAKGKVVYDEHASGKYTDADVAIIVVGETPYAEFMGDIGDGSGKYKLTLTKEHQKYVNAYAGKVPKIIVVLISGRPLVVTKQIKKSDAFVAAWLPGSESDGIAQVLFGDYNFKGKLPHSWPKSKNDFNGKYGPNFWDKTKKPLYKLGYGLKY